MKLTLITTALAAIRTIALVLYCITNGRLRKKANSNAIENR